MTELESVNVILAGLGETPLELLEEPYPADVSAMFAALRSAAKEIQLTGWHFNTEKDYPLLPDNSGYVRLPIDAHRASFPKYGDRYMARGTKVYDTFTHSYQIGRMLEGDITRILSFEDIPLAFQAYATIRAARKYQNNFLGSDSIGKFQEKDELEARIACLKEEQEVVMPNVRGNVLNGWSVGRVLRR